MSLKHVQHLLRKARDALHKHRIVAGWLLSSLILLTLWTPLNLEPLSGEAESLFLQVASHLGHLGLQALVLVGLATLLLISRDRLRQSKRWFSEEQRRTALSAANTPSGLLTDEPIELDRDDELRAAPFVKALAPHLILPPGARSIAVGVEGPWGMGKTSALNLLQREIHSLSAEAVVMRFNPWLIADRDDLIRAFLSELSVELKSKISKDLPLVDDALDSVDALARQLQTLASRAAKSGFESVDGALAFLSARYAPDATLSELRKDVEGKLARLGRPIVVMLDDLDRLRARELKRVFQLVKAACDFRGIAYVLAYQRSYVNEALGDGYLEKIVQLEVQLPQLDVATRRSYVHGRVLAASRSLGLVLRGEETAALDEAVSALTPLFSTPRNVVRFLNRMIVTATRTEVFFPDCVVFEALASRHPQLVMQLRAIPHKLALHGFDTADISYWERFLGHKGDAAKDRADMMAKLLDSVPSSQRPPVQSALEYLFPQFSDYGQEPSEEEAVTQNRATYYPALKRLLGLIGETAYSAQTARDFYQYPNERQSILRSEVTGREDPGFLSYLANFANRTPAVRPDGMIDDMLGFVRNEFDTLRRDSSQHAARLLYAIVFSDQQRDGRKQYFEQVVGDRRMLSVSERFLLDTLSSADLWRNGHYVGDEEALAMTRSLPGIDNHFLVAMKNKWLQVVAEEAAVRNLLATEPEAIGVLFRWAQLGGTYAPIQKYLRELLANDENLHIFLKHFDGSVSLSGVDHLIGNWAYLRERVMAFPGHSVARQKILDFKPARRDEAESR
jgi:hypothetical protein